MNVLMTGGAGQIDNAIVKALVENDHDVVVLGNLSPGERRALHPEAAFVKADITDDAKIVFTLLEHDIEAVVHSALLSELSSATEYFEQNTVASMGLLQALLECGVKKLVLSSTATFLDQGATTPINEERSLVPEDAYSESIYLIERMLSRLNQTNGLSYASVRYPNVDGEIKCSLRRQLVDIAEVNALALELLEDEDAAIYKLSDKGHLSKFGL